LSGDLQNAGTVTLAGALGGVGTLLQTSDAVLDLADNDFSVGSLGGAGTIRLGSATLTAGGSSADSLFAGVLSGTGGLTKTGIGTLTLTGTSTYSGTTTINAGSIQLGNGGTGGTLGTGSVVNGEALILNRSDAVTLANAISGTGLLAQVGTGTTTLTGANSYGGGTFVVAGRLRGDAASLQGDIRDDAVLEFAQTGAGTFGGRIFGDGVLEKTGLGTLRLTGDNSGFAGQTLLLAGRLDVDGALSRSAVTVAAGAALGGNGIVGGFTAQDGASIAPGSSVGILSVSGNFELQSGSTYVAEVAADGADLILASGTAQLAGTLDVTNVGGTYRFNSTYVLVRADGGRSGTFDLATGLDGFGQAFRPEITYTTTQVQLILAPNSLENILGTYSATPNQRAVRTAIDSAVVAGFDPQPLFALYNLEPAGALGAGLDALSGEIYATAARIALDDERLVREATLGRLRNTQDGAIGGAGGWGQAFGTWGDGDGDGNAAAYQRDQSGFVVGIDGGRSSDELSWRVGILGQLVRTTVSVPDRGSRGEVERAGVGLYAGIGSDRWGFRLGGTYARLELDADRRIVFPGFSESAQGETEGDVFQLFGELAWRAYADDTSFLEPFVGFSGARLELDAHEEEGEAAALSVGSQSHWLGTVSGGLRGETVVSTGEEESVRLGGSLALRHGFGDRSATAQLALAGAPDQVFAVRSAPLDPLAVVGSLDASIDLGAAATLTIGYSGAVGADQGDHGARATLSLRF
jgi:outer membrane autotransporter protein